MRSSEKQRNYITCDFSAGEIRSGRNRETETKNCGRHVRVTSETAIGHREKRNQLFKEHNRLLRISASPFGYVTSEIVGVVERKLNGFLVVSVMM